MSNTRLSQSERWADTLHRMVLVNPLSSHPIRQGVQILAEGTMKEYLAMRMQDYIKSGYESETINEHDTVEDNLPSQSARDVSKPITRLTRPPFTTTTSTSVVNRLPAEILNKIFRDLDIADSICFGLAAYPLYLAHRAFHHSEFIDISTEDMRKRLQRFMAGYHYHVVYKRFMTREQVYASEMGRGYVIWNPILPRQPGSGPQKCGE